MSQDKALQQQIFDHINRSARILIPLNRVPGGDAVASALALYNFLRKLDKQPQIVSIGEVPEKFQFLPEAHRIENHLTESRGFVISVRTENAPLENLSYHEDENAQLVNIYLKSKSGHYGPDDVTFHADKFPYDLIIALDTPSLDMLGELYDSHTDLFFETPIINIDHHPNNEHFGEINLVDITATSTAEILMELLESFEAGLIDAGIATNLLTGILVETNSFQHIKTTPKAFLRASSLISMGADQQEIIRKLYKTKSVSFLKLWGRALARLREVPELELGYTILKSTDMEKAGSQDLPAVMEELVASLTDPKIILLLAETGLLEVTGYYHLHPNLPSLDFASEFQAMSTNGQTGRFTWTGKTLQDAENEILQKLAKFKEKIGN